MRSKVCLDLSLSSFRSVRHRCTLSGISCFFKCTFLRIFQHLQQLVVLCMACCLISLSLVLQLQKEEKVQ